MLTKEISEVLKAASTASSLLNHSVLLKNSSGELVQSNQLAPTPGTPLCADADTATPGWMRTSGTTQNIPSGGNGCYLFTLQWDSAAMLQFFLAWKTVPEIWSRQKSSGTSADGWKGWVKLA